MTKKDYIKAVEMVRKDRLTHGEAIGQLTMETFVSFFQNDNPRFDENRFRKACKVG